MIQLYLQLKKTFILIILFTLITSNGLQKDEIGEVEYINVEAHKDWSFTLEYFRYDDSTKQYTSIQKIEQYYCDLSKALRTSVIHFQVSNDQQQVVLQGEQRQTQYDNSIIKIPLINVLRKNILMKPLCQTHQIDLYIYNFDHDRQGEIDLLYIKRQINSFQKRKFLGFKYQLLKLDLATDNFQQIQNLNDDELCRPQQGFVFNKKFKLEFYVISGDGKITSRFKRNVIPDDNLNLTPLMVNGNDNKIPSCIWFFNNDTLKIVLRQMKKNKVGNQHEDYTLIQYKVQIEDNKVIANFGKLDEINKVEHLKQCTLDNIEYLKNYQNFEFKYYFIKFKKLLTEFSSQNRDNYTSLIEDIMYISISYMSQFQSSDFTCQLQVFEGENQDDNKVYIHAYLQYQSQNVEGLVEEANKLKWEQENNTYEKVLDKLGDKKDIIINQQIIQDQELELKQKEIEEEGVQDQLVEELSEDQIENESESVQEDQETQKALLAREQYRKDRINNMAQILKNDKIKFQQILNPKIFNNEQQQDIKLIPKIKPQVDLGFNLGAVNKMSNQESSEETINKYRQQKRLQENQKQLKNFRAQQFQKLKQRLPNKKDSQDSSQDIPIRRNRLKINDQDNQDKKPLNVTIQNKDIQKINQIRARRYNPISKEKFFQEAQKYQYKQPQNPDQIKQNLSQNTDDINKYQRVNRFDRKENLNEENKRIRSRSLSPVPIKLKQPIKLAYGDQQIEILKRIQFNKQKLLEKIRDDSDQIKAYRRSRFNSFRLNQYKRSRSISPVIREKLLFFEGNQQTESPRLKIQSNDQITPQRRAQLDQLRQKMYQEKQWFVQLQDDKLYIKNQDNTEVQFSKECQPFNKEHVNLLKNINDQAKRVFNFQWINEENIFKRELQWQSQEDNIQKGIWTTDNNQQFQGTEFLLRYKLTQQYHYCMYKVHKEYTEIMFIRNYSNVSYHKINYKDNKLKYEIYSNQNRKLIMTCEQEINNLQNMPQILAYFTDSFGLTQQLKQKMISISNFKRQFLVYDKENHMFPPTNVFCVIDQGEYEFKNRLSLRNFEIPEDKNFQFAQVYFKDFKIRIFDLYYNEQPQIQILDFDYTDQFQVDDLSTAFYVINTFVHQSMTSKTNLLKDGYKIRLPFLLLDKNKNKRIIKVKFNKFKHNNFLFIYLQPQDNTNMQAIRSGLYLTSNYQLNYFVINDHTGDVLETALERNEQIDHQIRVRQTNNQLFLYKNFFIIENNNQQTTEYIDIHNDSIILYEGYYLETSLLDCLPYQYDIKLLEAKVKLESFTISIEQKILLHELI